LLSSFTFQITGSISKFNSNDPFKYSLFYIEWASWFIILGIFISSYSKNNKRDKLLLLNHLLLIRTWLPMLDWDQRCLSDDPIKNTNFYCMCYITVIALQVINNLSNNIYVALVESLLSIIFIQIGGVRLGADKCQDIPIIEVFT